MSLLGIDLGTSSVKVVLTDAGGAVLAQSVAGYPVSRPHPGWAETDPEHWWHAIADAIGKVLASLPADPPLGIGLSGQMHGVVLCTADGTPVRPAVLWADARAEAELATYRALPPAAYARLANPLSPGMAGPALAWLHAHEPDVVASARHALQPKDWVRAQLTGQFHGEPSDASATLLYDVLAQGWDDAVIAALRIRRDLLPDLLPSAGSMGGCLRTRIAAELGLPEGLPVAAGAADTAAAAFGSGLFDVGTVQLTIGTGVQFVTPVAAPTADSLPEAPSTHLYRSATPDGWYAMAASLTGGQTLDWVRRILGLDWAQLYATAARGSRPGDPVFLPHLIGERTPYLDTSMRGSWAGLDTRHDRDALCFSALEGVAFAIADAYQALAGPVPAEIRLAGGGSVCPDWRQLLADVLRTPLRAVDVPHASARGAALLGGQTAGLLSDADLVEQARPVSGKVVQPRVSSATLDERRMLYHDALKALRQVRFAR